MIEAIKFHQAAIGKEKGPEVISMELKEWEGWNSDQMRKDKDLNNFTHYSENGNIFVLYYSIFKQKVPVNYLYLGALFSIATLLMLYYFSMRPHFTLPDIAILASCLYMITDLFSPIFRHQYNTVPWIFPLLIAGTLYKPSYKWIYVLLVSGILLNIINLSVLKMEHTIGEYLFLSVLLYFIFVRNRAYIKLSQ
jgi:hypothetical protein